MAPVRVLFVCMGNICRSPTAEGIMRALVAGAGLAATIEVDSAGTGGWHAGEAPDQRAASTARRRGVELTHRARKLAATDLERFDYVLAMDADNLRGIEMMARGRARAEVRLLRGFDPDAAPAAEVPDPYYGGDHGFEQVYDICERACRGLLDHLRRVHGL